MYFCGAMGIFHTHHKKITDGDRNLKLAGSEGWLSIFVNILELLRVR